jgi:hypothetical protein
LESCGPECLIIKPKPILRLDQVNVTMPVKVLSVVTGKPLTAKTISPMRMPDWLAGELSLTVEMISPVPAGKLSTWAVRRQNIWN